MPKQNPIREREDSKFSYYDLVQKMGNGQMENNQLAVKTIWSPLTG